MPELPEVETVMCGLEPVMSGQVISDLWLGDKGLRYPFPAGLADRVTGARIKNLDRRAKYIFCHMDNGRTLILHLGMSGRVRILPHGSNLPPELHDHVKLTLESGMSIVLNDARRFGMLFDEKTDDIPKNRFFKYLGPEPLSEDFNPDYFKSTFQNKKVSVKVALMDQRVVVGVGNIYASEALYRAGISPRRKACNVGYKALCRLCEAVKIVLNQAIDSGGSSLRDHRTAYGDFGYFQQQLSVYARAGLECPACTCHINETGGIQKIVQGGRATYFCPRQQR